MKAATQSTLLLIFISLGLYSFHSDLCADETKPVHIVGGGYFDTPSQAFANAKDGDRIEVESKVYNDVGVLNANNVTVLGVGGRPKIDGKGKIADGRGIWVIYGSNTVIENFELMNEDNGKRGELAWNQAAIYLKGNTLTMRGMHIHDNMQGFFNETRSGAICNLTVEDSLFERNGDGGGHSHNLYANHNITKLTMRGVWSRDCRGGHIVKVRAFESDIQGCMFTDQDGISLGWFLDFPNGGNHRFAGNIVARKSKRGDFLLPYGEDKFDNPRPHQLLIAQNTFVNNGEGRFFNVQHITADIRQNILVGPNSGDTKNQVSDNQIAQIEELMAPIKNDYRIAKPNNGRTNFVSFEFAAPSNSKERMDNAYGGYSP